MKLARMLIALHAALLTGCVYDAPLTTEHTIAIDPALLGVWEIVPDEGETDLASPLVVVPFSSTEYLIHEQSGKDGRFYRGYRVVLGGVPCLQLQDIGSGAGPRPAAAAAAYVVVSYEVDGDEMQLRLLNDEHVPSRLKTPADLQRAFLAHKHEPDLFEPLARCRRLLLPNLDLPPATASQRTEAGRERVVTVAFSPSGHYLLAGMESGGLAAIDLHHGRLHWSLAAHEQAVNHIAFGGKDRWALTAGDDLKASLWNVNTGRLQASFEAAPMKRVYDIELSSDARHAVSRGFDGFGVVWDLRNNRKVRDIYSYGFALAPEGQTLVSTWAREPRTQLMRLFEGGEPLEILAGKIVGAVAINATGTMVAACGSSPRGPVVWLVRATDGELFGEIAMPPSAAAAEPAAATSAAFSASGRFLVIGSSDGRVARADIERRTVVDAWQLAGDHSPVGVGFIGAADDQLWAATTNDDFKTTTTKFAVGRPLPVWTLPGSVSFDGQRMLGAMAAHDGDLVFFNAADGKSLRHLRPFEQGKAWHDLDGAP